jgi:hypothetical protein
MPETFTIDTNISVEDAVKAYQAARTARDKLYNEARLAGTKPDPQSADELGHEIARTRAQAMFAVKRVTGYYPVDLAMMGL